jgi:hypothetical protein
MSSVLDTYRVGIGHNVALVSLVDIFPQPRSNPAAPTERKYALTGAVYDEGEYMELYWDHFEWETEYTTMLLQFTLTVNKSANVTIYGRDSLFTFRRFNGVAQRPEGIQDVKRSNFFIRDVVMRITHLVQL